MSIRALPWIATLVPVLVLAGCLNPRAVDLGGKECPCAEGWTCDPGTNLCVTDGVGGRDSGAADSSAGDTGASDSAIGDGGDSGTPTDAGAMDSAVPTVVTLWFEAEAATLDSELMVGSDSAASGGEFISAAVDGADNAVPGPDGKASFEVAIPRDGTYRLWGRVLAPGEMADSFWVCVDVAPPTADGCSLWNAIPAPTAWEWDAVRDSGDPASPATDYDLSAGVITIDIYRREATAQLDKIVLTNDLSFVPTGTGD